ncbi:DUF4352 domain-containing protein [Actinomadura darangshiensis]|uniref:DUF4352 domain-containing protein n=1 Tax=Actinomadura darangshiensis TaxID=705336 RepID=A0A4R5A0W1_9ACTN|nr:DUF4352 domain-containing protein [Actinomadura darangshiensis]TDD65045.1 DUF4352 domain-containing protein [Actinomadura darangshiensis]
MFSSKRALAASAMIFALGAAGCESATVNKTADNGSPESSSSGQKKGVAKPGDTVKITDKTQGIALKVTLVKVVKHAQASDEFTTPGPGKRFVAAKFRVLNSGDKTYQDSPSNGATLIDSSGQSYSAEILAAVSGCQGFANGEVTLTSGESQTGCLTFAIAHSAKPQHIRFGAASGFSGSAEWDVG